MKPSLKFEDIKYKVTGIIATMLQMEGKCIENYDVVPKFTHIAWHDELYGGPTTSTSAMVGICHRISGEYRFFSLLRLLPELFKKPEKKERANVINIHEWRSGEK